MTRTARLETFTALLGALVLVTATVVVLTHDADAHESFVPRTPVAELGGRIDWLTAQRAGPDGVIPSGAYQEALAQSRAVDEQTAEQAPGVAAPAWELIGPTNVQGRVQGIAVDPTDSNVVYVGSASGGVFKSTDAGDTFASVWPDDITQAIGDLVITADGTLFAGTGEAGPGGGSLTYGGDGVYRSTDGGETWENVGLRDSSRIARIVVDPTDPQRVFVAATGPLYEAGGQRGVYRSTDGGDTWTLVLAGANATTGAADLAIDPSNPDVLFTTMWDHQRTPEIRTYGGVGSGVYRSDDGGDTWQRVEGLPGDSEDVGRIAVAIAPSAPNVVYAMAMDAIGYFRSMHQSVDGGTTWTTIDTSPVVDIAMSSYGWWFGRIYVDPLVPTHLFVHGIFLLESVDGGLTFLPDLGVHADQQAMAWDPANPSRVYLGNDGGVYRSDSGGAINTYTHATYLPNNQLYTLDVSEQDPARVVAGLQDQGVVRSYTTTGEAGPDAWNEYKGGDGLEALINYEDQSIIYGCSQYGNCDRYENGGDTSGTFGSTTSDRRNWLTPLEFDPNDPNIMYYAGNIVNRSTDGGQSWEPISPDLTEGVSRDPAGYPFGTVTTVAPAASDPNRLYAGTDDGHLWTTTDLGETWTELTDPALPDQWVTRVTVDPADADTAYVTYSGYRAGDDGTYVFRTNDGGATWTDISGNLPNAPVNDLTFAGDWIAVASDVGVFASRNAANAAGPGVRWFALGDGLPKAPVMDLRYHAPTNSLTAGTFGRSAWRLPVPSARPAS